VPKGQKYCGACHAKETRRDLDARGGAAHERGYDARWHKYRNWFLGQHPLCVKCERAATVVDHIVPVNGADDPLFYESTNHQPLCRACHDVKHRADNGAWSKESRGNAQGRVRIDAANNNDRTH